MVRITYLGHSAFLLDSGEGSVLIDPFISGNPLAKTSPSDLRPDLILVTHAHDDHLGDAIEIARRSGATILSTFEVGQYALSEGVKAVPAHMGGKVDFRHCSVKLFPAWHSSSIGDRTLGMACSFVLLLGAKTFYHAGDTALFGDMRLIGEEFDVDVAMLPIGGHFTMGIEDAVRAAQLLAPKAVIPMHFNTFDVIRADPRRFEELLKRDTACTCMVMEVGECREI